MPTLNAPDRPKYAKHHRVLEDVAYDVWHKLVSLSPSKFPATALGACGERFEPEGFIFAERTLLDWREEDDLCECAAEMPTEAQCKNQLTQLKIGSPLAPPAG